MPDQTNNVEGSADKRGERPPLPRVGRVHVRKDTGDAVLVQETDADGTVRRRWYPVDAGQRLR